MSEVRNKGARPVVIYHSADFDGLFSGAVALRALTRKYLGSVQQSIKPCTIEPLMIGWDYGDPVPEIPEGTMELYMIDISVDGLMDHPGLIWIDHHKSAMEKYGPKPGLQIDGVAACRLAFQWFRHQDLKEAWNHAAFFHRLLPEPDALRLVGEYDVWDKRDPDAERLQYGLTASGPWSPVKIVDRFFDTGMDGSAPIQMINDGAVAMRWQAAFAAGVCEQRGYMVNVAGVQFWTLCSVHTRNSMWFPDASVPAEAEGLMALRLEGDGKVRVSLYQREGCDHDLSVIAVEHGGGGHRGACGFEMTLGQAITRGLIR